MKDHKHFWQLQAAKARFSELFRRARSEGPQYVTRQGKDAVVVIRAEEFDRLKRRNRKTSLVQFFAESPLVGSGIDPQTQAGLRTQGQAVSGFLLDTNVISELVRPRPDPRVVRWMDTTDEELFFLSVLTLGEIRKGITVLTDPARNVRRKLGSAATFSHVSKAESCPLTKPSQSAGVKSPDHWPRRDPPCPSSMACSLPLPWTTISPSSRATPVTWR